MEPRANCIKVTIYFNMKMKETIGISVLYKYIHLYTMRGAYKIIEGFVWKIINLNRKFHFYGKNMMVFYDSLLVYLLESNGLLCRWVCQ